MSDFKISIPVKIINYIYDFCTYKRKFNLRVFFEQIEINKSDGFNYFYIRCVNQTTYNIKITKLYVDDFDLELAHHYIKDAEVRKEYKKWCKKPLQDENLNLNTDLNLTPSDGEEQRYFINGRVENKNEMRIKARLKGQKTKVFIEYEIRDIQRSFFFNNVRLVKVVIPI